MRGMQAPSEWRGGCLCVRMYVCDGVCVCVVLCVYGCIGNCKDFSGKRATPSHATCMERQIHIEICLPVPFRGGLPNRRPSSRLKTLRISVGTNRNRHPCKAPAFANTYVCFFEGGGPVKQPRKPHGWLWWISAFFENFND